MHKYAFATLAIGVTYNYKVKTLIDCVLLMTCGDLYVITDDVNDIEEHLRTYPELDSDRITIIDIVDVTSEQIWFEERKFNFNLKRLPVTIANARGEYDLIVHCDADSFMIDWNEEEFQTFIHDTDTGMIARMRNRPSEEGGLYWLLEPKANALSIDISAIKSKLPIEVVMFFNPRNPKFNTFLKEWEGITDRCYNRGVNPFIEALEISWALDESELNYSDLLTYLRRYKTLNCFRYLHHDKIMRII